MRTALITGGAKGIGAAVAHRLAEMNFNVVIAYRNSGERAAALADKLSRTVRALAVPCDVSDRKAVDDLYMYCRKNVGIIDTVINNAGLALYKLFQDTTDEEYEQIMNTNCRGSFYVTRAFLPDMLSAGFGRIVNVASMWGVTGAAMETVYSMSKAALIGMTKALAKEVGPSGVTVNAVAPGVVATDMLADFTSDDLHALAERTPLQRIGSPDDVAQAVAYLIAQDSFVTGQVLHINGGYVI